MHPAERAARDLFDAINSRELERIHDLVTDTFVDHGAPPGLVTPGAAGYITIMEFVTGVLDIRYEIHDVVAAVDRVALRSTGHVIHRTYHLGVPATGRPYAMASMHIYRSDGDRLAEHWGVRDELSCLYQVGALTPGPLPALSR